MDPTTRIRNDFAAVSCISIFYSWFIDERLVLFDPKRWLYGPLSLSILFLFSHTFLEYFRIVQLGHCLDNTKNVQQ